MENRRRRRWIGLAGLLTALLALGVAVVWLRKSGKEEPLNYCIVYHPDYNIGLLGLEQLHPFDSRKYGRVFGALQRAGAFDEEGRLLSPDEASRELLLKVHPAEYLDSLRSSRVVAYYVEVGPVALMPAGIVDRNLLRPMRLAAGGTLLAGREALQRDLAINLGGGFHHASSKEGGGFCVYADITLAIRALREEGLIRRAMIVDLDAHQGNGHETDFIGDDSVYIFDMYNAEIYPKADAAKAAIDCHLPLRMNTEGRDYLRILRENLPAAIDAARPDLLIYNAGTDVYEHDPLGGLRLTREDIIQRDADVLTEARRRGVPVLMLLSGGYTKESHEVIAESLCGLLGLVYKPE
ncbi:histone deacetylase [Candidatus Sumerlaeota bacterium]|nr:histone deacetylase [Candidatus Sumerlaeota bacterium]